MNQIGERVDLDGIDALATGVALLDETLCFARVNLAFCEMAGVGARRLLERPISVLHADPRLEAASRRVSQQGGGSRLDAVARLRVGETLPTTPRLHHERALDQNR